MKMELLSNFNLFFLTGIIVVVYIVVKRHYQQKFSYWTKRGISSLPASIPFGNLTEQILTLKSQGQALAEIYSKFEKLGVKYGGFYSAVRPELLILDPDLIKTIMVKEFSNFHNRPFVVDTKLDPFLGHLFLLRDEQWRFMRNKLSPTFTSGKMKMMFSTLLDCSNRLEDALSVPVQTAEPVEIKDISARFTTDVIGSCAFGIDCNSLINPDAEFRKYGRMNFEISKWQFVRNILAIFCPAVIRILKLTHTKEAVQNFFMNIVRETVNYREQNHIERKDFLDLLIKMKNNENIDDDDNHSAKASNKSIGSTLTFTQMVANCFVFFNAGFETSSSTMSYCLFELCQNPDIQEKLRNEIVETLKKNNGELTYEAIFEMSYMDKVIKETLRKYPILPVLVRQCAQDFRIPDSDVLIPKNTPVYVSTLGIQRNPKYFPNPMQFDPERFTDEEKAKRHPYTYMPFGEGPRNCIGMRFGLMQTKMGIAKLLSHFKFTLNEKTVTPLNLDAKRFTMVSTGGVWLNVQKVVS